MDAKASKLAICPRGRRNIRLQWRQLNTYDPKLGLGS